MSVFYVKNALQYFFDNLSNHLDLLVYKYDNNKIYIYMYIHAIDWANYHDLEHYGRNLW